MYDTVKLWLATNETDKIPDLLKEPKKEIMHTGEYRHYGNLENLRIGVYQDSLKAEGSLNKFIHGNNLVRLTRKDTEQAIEKLSDSLRLPFHQAKVYRFDLADNFILKRPVSEYLSLLGETRYFIRSTYKKQGLNYSNCRRSMIFYDKIKELKNKRQAENITEDFQGRNVLRYELRYTKRLKSQFQNEIKAYHLFDENFYIRVINQWAKEYFRINKQKKLKMDTIKMQGVKDLNDQMFLYALESMGGEQVLFEIFESERASGNLDRFKHKRFKDRIKRIVNNPKYFEPNDSILELDQKISDSQLNIIAN